MTKRIFILGSIGFPRGGAGANYDQYVALALKECGWEVIIIGCGINREEDLVNSRYLYKGIEYWNENNSIKVKYGIALRHYKNAHFKYRITKDDYFIIRDLGWMTLVKTILRYGTHNMCYVHFEDVLPLQYNKAFINPKYWTDVIKWFIKNHFIKKSLPISERLEKIDKSYGCECLRLPIMADPYEYDYIESDKKPNILQFIYPGAKLNGCEDNIELMLRAFSELSQEEKNHIKLHITGVTKNKLIKKIHNAENIIQRLDGVLIIHDWMEYNDLIRLYQSVDFLILVRYKNKITIANFPSKVPETLCFGIIPVCTEVGEYTMSYLRNNKNSIVFSGEMQQECMNAIRKAINLSESDYLRYRKEARTTAIEEFSYKKWSKRLNDFILS